MHGAVGLDDHGTESHQVNSVHVGDEGAIELMSAASSTVIPHVVGAIPRATEVRLDVDLLARVLADDNVGSVGGVVRTENDHGHVQALGIVVCLAGILASVGLADVLGVSLCCNRELTIMTVSSMGMTSSPSVAVKMEPSFMVSLATNELIPASGGMVLGQLRTAAKPTILKSWISIVFPMLCVRGSLKVMRLWSPTAPARFMYVISSDDHCPTMSYTRKAASEVEYTPLRRERRSVPEIGNGSIGPESFTDNGTAAVSNSHHVNAHRC